MMDKANGQSCYVRAKHLAQETQFASFAHERKHIEYVHVLLPQHATLISDDVPSESFYPGPNALENLSETARESLYSVLPRLKYTLVRYAYGDTARPVKKRKEVRELIAAGNLEILSTRAVEYA